MLITSLRDEVLRTFEPIAADRRLHLDLQIAERTPHSIRTDRQRIGQILKNLLSNAFKFTDTGQCLCISRVMTSDFGSSCEIPASVSPRISCRPFSRHFSKRTAPPCVNMVARVWA